ncbi:MAG: hypothetical protein JO346_01750 [Alphaproteobacteria bacterium]|nr:hypothetical protein [Alphaproteobacteria bacterium]
MAALLTLTGVGHAAEFGFDGYADVRLVAPSGTRSYLDGGLGKLRFEHGDSNIKLGDLYGEVRASDDAWFALADIRISPEYGNGIDLTQVYVRYAPPSGTNWHWSARAGAFFPPFSLENEQLGWSTFWTLTPSAINSWVGAELRTIGAEGTVEWTSNGNAITLIGAVFGFNDPAGLLMADRGWNFDDRIVGLFEKSRLPDAISPGAHRYLFRELDNSPGWYLDLSYEIDGKTGFELMRYDNEADPRRPRAWHTKFWEAGFRQQLGPITLLAQGMSGDTVIRPTAAAFIATDFDSAYALIGWDLDDWWLAARADVFQTRTRTAAGPSALSEDGHAFDLTASWVPRRWLRLSAEALLVEDRRAQRALVGETPQQSEHQFQLVARTYF